MNEFSSYWKNEPSPEDAALHVARSLVESLGYVSELGLLERASALSDEIEAAIPSPEEKFIGTNSKALSEELTASDWHAAYLACESLFTLYRNRRDLYQGPIEANSWRIVLLDQPTTEDDPSLRAYATLKSFTGIALSPEEMELIVRGDYMSEDAFFAVTPNGTRFDSIAGMNFALYQKLGVVDRYYEGYVTPSTDFFTYTLLPGEVDKDKVQTGHPVAHNSFRDNPLQTFSENLEHVAIRPVLPITAFK